MSDKPFFVRSVLEKEIERDGCAYAFKRGWLEVKLTSPTRNGWPDRFYCRKGVIVLVEWKKAGEAPTRQQLKVHRELRDHGVDVHVLDNIEDAKRLFL